MSISPALGQATQSALSWKPRPVAAGPLARSGNIVSTGGATAAERSLLHILCARNGLLIPN